MVYQTSISSTDIVTLSHHDNVKSWKLELVFEGAKVSVDTISKAHIVLQNE